MKMDVTTMFNACVKTVHLRNKDLGSLQSTKSPLKKSSNKSAFYIKTQAVVAQISKLREYLLENRKAYLNFSNYLSNLPHMTDMDRDSIDTGAQKIMSTCSQLLKDLRREIALTDVSPQYNEHREIVLILIEEYLKNVCKIYSEQKALRVKRAIEMRKITKLEPELKAFKKIEHDIKETGLNASIKPNDNADNVNNSNDSSPLKIQEMNGDISPLLYEEELSPEDVQMLESENEQLYNELNTLNEEVKQIESKVIRITELQEIFTEKVLDQDKDLDRLVTTVVGTTENVKDANEQIRQAIQRKADIRVWTLFSLLVMSFSLLFLDWYNP